MRHLIPPALASAVLAIATFVPAQCDAQENIGGLAEVGAHQLSDGTVSRLGQAALAIRATEWKHAETKNFIYHYFQSFVATPVSVEAEFFHSMIARELGKETAPVERKAHIYIFETAADWDRFKTSGALDPWTGGLHVGGDLFLVRVAENKWKGNTLGHEVAHLVVHRLFGPGIPLWLNEGYAEYASSRGYAAFHRARGYRARPNSHAVDPSRYVALAQLTSATAYPQDTEAVFAFYNQCERLVRFLSAADKRGFNVFFEAMSKGERIEAALAKGFSSRFPSLEALDREFKTYATKDHGSALPD
jgi:hypothetical protein